MKIVAIDTLVVDAGMRNWIFVKVQTDQPGLHGWGEATLEWKTRGVVGAVGDLAMILTGEDPADITRCCELMTKRGYWPMGAVARSAMSAIETALWDINGKALGVPVWRLLGGKVRDRVRVYTHLGMGDMTATYRSFSADQLVAHGRALKGRGYAAVKIANVPFTHYTSDFDAVDSFAASVHGLRDALGPDFAIMIDFHGRPASPRAALDYIEAVRDARLLFVEEPIQPGNTRALAELRQRSPIAVAAGERLIEPTEFADVIAARAVDVIQPDLCHCGGLSAGRRIAEQAALAGIGVAPHNPAGPIAGAAALHFAVATPNHVIQEEMVGAVAWYDEVVLSTPIVRDGGYWCVPDAPGLGIEIDEAVARRHPPGSEPLQSRDAVMADGTVVDW